MPKATYDQIMDKVDEISRRYDSDSDHNRQVTRLALTIYDELGELHHLHEHERRLLEMAGRMHDIGWSKTVVKKHHKISCEMILESGIPGLDEKDRLIVALIARYHTKGVPNPNKHPAFASLNRSARKTVEWLAGILRIADALDSSHNRVVRDLNLEIRKKVLTVSLEANTDLWDEIRRVRRKDDLLIKKIKRPIVYQC